ncbi:MAG: dienelactone hydrolase family protein [Methanomicrobiales archaeon]|nr:dienelactone hydrolase family protein [Methanomicrobiales archaeon]NYT21871.1 dienelactone hydrolase family protein [Methanomicrobiales archaeon]
MKYSVILLVILALALCAGCTSQNGGLPPARPEGETVTISSGDLDYPAYLASPGDGQRHPGVVLVHSFRGLEPGYRDMTDRFASEGFVVIAPEWQTYEQSPRDEVVGALISDAVIVLKGRDDVDPGRLGLTGFCAGGRYTMLFLPQMEEFRSGVAWYGFPYSGGFANQTAPASLVSGLGAPMLIIHGTADTASPVADIYRYATELDSAGKYFELKVYQGEPHGFMIVDGALSGTPAAQDAFGEMVRFFSRTL